MPLVTVILIHVPKMVLATQSIKSRGWILTFDKICVDGIGQPRRRLLTILEALLTNMPCKTPIHITENR